MAYACLACFIGYMLRVEPGFWILSVGLVNVPFFAMEIRHSFCKEFVMIVGEIGPVEVELIYSVLFFMTGAVLGGDFFDRPIG